MTSFSWYEGKHDDTGNKYMSCVSSAGHLCTRSDLCGWDGCSSVSASELVAESDWLWNYVIIISIVNASVVKSVNLDDLLDALTDCIPLPGDNRSMPQEKRVFNRCAECGGTINPPSVYWQCITPECNLAFCDACHTSQRGFCGPPVPGLMEVSSQTFNLRSELHKMIRLEMGETYPCLELLKKQPYCILSVGEKLLPVKRQIKEWMSAYTKIWEQARRELIHDSKDKFDGSAVNLGDGFNQEKLEQKLRERLKTGYHGKPVYTLGEDDPLVLPGPVHSDVTYEATIKKRVEELMAEHKRGHNRQRTRQPRARARMVAGRSGETEKPPSHSMAEPSSPT
jgi:hypothetical protein